MVRLKTTRKVLQIKTNYNKWLDEIKKCWENKRLDILSTILSENLQYFESPFGPPLTDKKQIVERWKKDLKRQEKIKFSHMILSFNRNGCVANWAASFIKEEKVVNLEGIFHFKLGSDNRCFYFKQWWVVK